MAIAALQAGKHVICEKPMALNVAEAEAMLAAAQAAPNQLAIIDHELRFHPQRIHLRRLLREGYVGELIAVHLDRLGSERLNPALPWGWLSDVERGGGMLGAVGSHLLDLARWLVGRIDNLTAQLQIGHARRQDPVTGIAQPVTADDHAHLLLRFANHAQGTLTASGLTPGGYGMSITLIGAKGALRLDNQDQLWGAQGDALHQGQWLASPHRKSPTFKASRPLSLPATISPNGWPKRSLLVKPCPKNPPASTTVSPSNAISTLPDGVRKSRGGSDLILDFRFWIHFRLPDNLKSKI
jgi:predicted dehydrogenase